MQMQSPSTIRGDDKNKSNKNCELKVSTICFDRSLLMEYRKLKYKYVLLGNKFICTVHYVKQIVIYILFAPRCVTYDTK